MKSRTTSAKSIRLLSGAEVPGIVRIRRQAEVAPHASTRRPEHGSDPGRTIAVHGPVVPFANSRREGGRGDGREAKVDIERLEARDCVHEEVLAAAPLHELGHDAAGVPPSAKENGREDRVDLATVRVAPAHGERAEGPVREEGEDPVDGRVAPCPVVVAPDLGGEGKLGRFELTGRERAVEGQTRVNSYVFPEPSWLIAGRVPSAAIWKLESVTGFA